MFIRDRKWAVVVNNLQSKHASYEFVALRLVSMRNIRSDNLFCCLIFRIECSEWPFRQRIVRAVPATDFWTPAWTQLDRASLCNTVRAFYFFTQSLSFSARLFFVNRNFRCCFWEFNSIQSKCDDQLNCFADFEILMSAHLPLTSRSVVTLWLLMTQYCHHLFIWREWIMRSTPLGWNLLPHIVPNIPKLVLRFSIGPRGGWI